MRIPSVAASFDQISRRRQTPQSVRRQPRSSTPVRRIVAAATGLLIVLAATAAVAGAGGRDPIESVPHFGHVFVIVGENTSLSQLTPASTPYLTGAFKDQSAWVTNFDALTNVGSLPNYIGMTSGQYTNCQTRFDSPHRCQQGVNNIFHQLDGAGISWTSWAESMTNACSAIDSGTGWAKNIYATHHNPVIYYNNIHGPAYSEATAPSQECQDKVLPMGSTSPNDTSAFDSALASGAVSNFNFIVPNECEDGHDPCGLNRLRQFDEFLAREVPKIEASPAFGTDGVIIVTYDEGDDQPGQGANVLFAATGPLVIPGVYSSTPVNDYSLLRTLEDGLGTPAYLGNAAKAQPINFIWK